MPRNTEIKMLDNGHLVEVENTGAVDLKAWLKMPIFRKKVKVDNWGVGMNKNIIYSRN